MCNGPHRTGPSPVSVPGSLSQSLLPSLYPLMRGEAELSSLLTALPFREGGTVLLLGPQRSILLFRSAPLLPPSSCCPTWVSHSVLMITILTQTLCQFHQRSNLINFTLNNCVGKGSVWGRWVQGGVTLWAILHF